MVGKMVAVVKNNKSQKRVIKTTIDNGYTAVDFIKDLENDYTVEQLYTLRDYNELLRNRKEIKKQQKEIERLEKELKCRAV